jgi:hypothetical protein
MLSEGFPSGQREQTVNLSAQPSEVRILPPPPSFLSFYNLIKLRKQKTCFELTGIDSDLHLLLCVNMDMRVWYNGRTSAFQADDAGPIPATRSKFNPVITQQI